MDMSGFQNDATYGQIKQKYGIIEYENNKPKSESARQSKCPPEKKAAITEALKFFGMN